MQVSVPCPHCNWQEINGNFIGYAHDGKGQRGMTYDMRCTRCNHLFTIEIPVRLVTKREGSKNYGG